MVEFFLSHAPSDDSETRTRNKRRDTALHCAARSGGSKCVELLVKKDSEVCTWSNDANESPLYLTIVSRFNIEPEIILNHASSLQYHNGQNGVTELHAAVLNQKYPFKAIRKLVEWKKEMIRKGDDSGMTPLHYAAFHGRNREVKLFVENDPSAIYCLNRDGQSALYVAAFNGQVDVFTELVKRRPDCYNIVDKMGRSALHAAVLGDQLEMIEFVSRTPSLARLMSMGDNGGDTPLHLAAYYLSFNVIKSFRWNEKACFALNHNSFTPFDVYNQQMRKEDILQLEEQRCKEIIEAGPHLHCAKGVLEVRKLANEELKMNKLSQVTMINEISKSKDKKRQEFRCQESALEVNLLLVAMLVATVTFAVGFAVPGSGRLVNNGADEGLAALANKPTFKAFVAFNTLAFSCSIFAVLIHFGTSLAHRGARIQYQGVAACFTALAIVAMVLAKCFGTSIM